MRGVTIRESEILDRAIKGDIDKKPMITLRILTKYYLLQEETTRDEVFLKLDSYMREFYIGYKPSKWSELLKQLVKSVSQYNEYDIKDVESIAITEEEWNSILELNNKQLEKLAFILLIYAKVNNEKIFNNENKVGQNLSDILTESGLQRTEESKKLLNILFNKGYISQGKSCNVTSIKVEFARDGVEKIKISNFENVISYFNEFRNEVKYIECENCSKRVLQVSKKPIKYCMDCAKKIDRTKAIERWKVSKKNKTSI